MQNSRKLMSLVAVVAVIGIAMSLPAAVFAGCTMDLVDCMEDASEQSSFIRRAAAGLDCELEFAGCVRKVIIGR